MGELAIIENDENEQKLTFNETMIKVTTNLIAKKKSFCDFMLSLSWRMIEKEGQQRPEDSDLFKTIMETSEAIVNEKDKRDWYWMKKVMLDSHVESFVAIRRVACLRVSDCFRFGCAATRRHAFFISDCTSWSSKHRWNKLRGSTPS